MNGYIHTRIHTQAYYRETYIHISKCIHKHTIKKHTDALTHCTYVTHHHLDHGAAHLFVGRNCRNKMSLSLSHVPNFRCFMWIHTYTSIQYGNSLTNTPWYCHASSSSWSSLCAYTFHNTHTHTHTHTQSYILTYIILSSTTTITCLTCCVYTCVYTCLYVCI